MRNLTILTCLTSVAIISVAQTSNEVTWDYQSVPISIEVRKDVPVKMCGFERGVLCAKGNFVIPKGARFQMLEIAREGGCAIEYLGLRYEPSSCPWLLGFADRQKDTFVIVETPEQKGG